MILFTAPDSTNEIFEANSLPMFDLENLPGVRELSREVDSSSDPIVIERGLVLGNDVITTAQVFERHKHKFTLCIYYKYIFYHMLINVFH